MRPLQMQSHGLSITPVSIKQLRALYDEGQQELKMQSATKLNNSLKTLLQTISRHQEDLNLMFANH
jgi:hypothetical protein